MYPTERDFTAHQERHQDRLRQLARRQILQAAGLPRPSGRSGYRRALVWLGGRLVSLGATLQRYGDPAPLRVRSTRARLSR